MERRKGAGEGGVRFHTSLWGKKNGSLSQENGGRPAVERRGGYPVRVGT